MNEHDDLVRLTAGALAGIEGNSGLVNTTATARGKAAVRVACEAHDQLIKVESLQQSATIAMNGRAHE